MPIVTIQPGMTGADYVYLTPAIKTWLLEHDVRFVCRYLVPPETTRINKDLKPEEVEWCADHGIAIVPIWEIRHDDADGGAAKGAAAGHRIVQLAQQFGIPTGTPLLCAVDQDTYYRNVATHTAYVDAFEAIVNGAGYIDGIYGDVDIARAATEDIFWRANAGGWGAVRPGDRVHVQQHRALYPPGVDPNTCLISFPAWSPGRAPTLPEGPTMLTGYNGQPRIADTRDGTGVRKGIVGGGELVRVGIPAGADGESADMAIVTVTVSGATAPGYVQVDGTRFGAGSNGNYQPGDTEAVSVLAAVDPESGTIGIRLTGGSGHVIVDLMGVVTNAAMIDGELIQRLVKQV